MIAMIGFLLSDIIIEFYKKDFCELKKKLKIMIIISICGFIGFAVALSIHGYYRIEVMEMLLQVFKIFTIKMF